MTTFTKNITLTETILILSGCVFIASTVYLSLGGDLTMNFFAKGFYIFGTLLLVFKS